MLGGFSNTGDDCRSVAQVMTTSEFCDVQEATCTEISDGSIGSASDMGDGIAIASAGLSTPSSGAVASAGAPPILRVITEGNACASGPISTNPPCSVSICIVVTVGDLAPPPVTNGRSL
jgi:hypothetical protein